ncbi:MAG: FAD-binding oxidoreductase [Ignavibacteriales bacterium]
MKDSLKEITNIVGENNASRYSVDGKRPDIVVFPETVEEVSQIMKVASRDSLAVIPWGGGTKIGFGREPQKVDVVICTGRLNRIIEYEPSDLVGIAECGIPLRDFQKALGEKSQFLAIDPPHIESGATLGGIIATNDSGPRRLRYGTMRESLIGIKVVRADGSIIKGGAKVVKNVAGYDLPKLYVGSLGTLGIIVEGTFRLYPIPETSKTLLVSFPNLETLHETVLLILNSSFIPSCLEALNPPLVNVISEKLNLSLKNGEYALAVRIEGVEKAVRDQISRVKNICREKNGEGVSFEGRPQETLWQEIWEFPWRVCGENRIICKASVLITDVPKVLQALEELSKSSGLRIYASARAGSGILIISIEIDSTGLPREEILQIVESINSLRGLVISLKGTLVIQEAPLSLKSQIDIWGEVGTSINVMKKLKTLFDPNSILNPRRFAGGI